jgi:hypothetical protein
MNWHYIRTDNASIIRHAKFKGAKLDAKFQKPKEGIRATDEELDS